MKLLKARLVYFHSSLESTTPHQRLKDYTHYTLATFYSTHLTHFTVFVQRRPLGRSNLDISFLGPLFLLCSTTYVSDRGFHKLHDFHHYAPTAAILAV